MAKTLYICTPNGDKAAKWEGERFVETPLKAAKKGYCAAVVPVAALRSHSFKIPLETAEEKLPTLVEIRMYEEGGLDVEREYAVAYVRHPLHYESAWLVEGFAAKASELGKLFAPVLKRTGHIDLLAVPFLVYEALYLHDRAEKEGVDLFLYLGDDASFAALYKEGRYLAHRLLPSLQELALKADVSPEALRETLRTRGLEAKAYGPDEGRLLKVLQESFVQMVERVAHTVGHKRGLFGFEGVDRVWLDFEKSEIPGLWELMEGYGFDTAAKGPLACCETLPPEAQHAGVEALYLQSAAEGHLEAPNLTLFTRRPPWWRSHTGRFAAAVAAAVLLVGGYGFYTSWLLDEAESERAALQARLDATKSETKRLQRELKRVRRAKEAAARALEERRMALMAFDEAADTMGLIKASALKRRQMVRDVDEALKRFKLSALSMEQNGSRRMRVEILTRYERREDIARFMKRLADEGYGSVGTREIWLDDTLYQSGVEIVR
ncbi:hypothetical protein [Hydrogenimonas sp.]